MLVSVWLTLSKFNTLLIVSRKSFLFAKTKKQVENRKEKQTHSLPENVFQCRSIFKRWYFITCSFYHIVFAINFRLMQVEVIVLNFQSKIRSRVIMT